MGNDTYTSVPLDDGPESYALEKRQRPPRLEKAMRVATLSLISIVVFLLGFAAGDRYGQTVRTAVSVGDNKETAVAGGESGKNGTLLPPQAFVPDCEWSSIFIWVLKKSKWLCWWNLQS